MSKEQLAALLNGREIGSEITREEEIEAKVSGLIVIFGASDDLIEFRGVISDETGGPGTAYMRYSDLLPEHEDCGCDFCGYEDAKRSSFKIEASFSSKEYPDYPWWIEPPYDAVEGASVPFATFDIMEDGEKYCRGIVLDRKDLYAF